MEALGAVISIIAIVATVLVVGGLIAFIGHMVLGVFDGGRQVKQQDKDIMDYTQYKEFENAKEQIYSSEYNFEAINESKAQKEKEMLKNAKDNIFDLDEDEDEELEKFEREIKQQEEKVQKTVKDAENVDAEVIGVDGSQSVEMEEDEDDFDLDSMLNEISDEVIEEEKSETNTEIEMDSTLKSYNIDEILKQSSEEEEVEEDEEEIEEDFAEDIDFEDLFEEDEEEIEEEVVEEIKQPKMIETKAVEEPKLLETKTREVKSQIVETKVSEEQPVIIATKAQEAQPAIVENKVAVIKESQPVKVETSVQATQPKAIESKVSDAQFALVQTGAQEMRPQVVETRVPATREKIRKTNHEIVHGVIELGYSNFEQPITKVEENAVQINSEVEDLKAQLAELNRQLELAKAAKVEVVKIVVSEDECVQKIELLEERLKNVKKDYKINLKEYRPLKKVMNDLERYQTKLRRKEAIVAKKKVALYGVNNYVDIDKEKAEKLANELELLDGLRLSVNHCEEVISANKDRFPILEHTHQILEDQIAHLEYDLAQAQETLKKIREGNGNGENGSEE